MEIIKRFDDIIKSCSHDPIVFELGVNDGYHTRIMNNTIRKHRKLYRYCAFEPDPRLKSSITRVVKDFPNISFLQCAIGAKNDDIDFHLSSGHEIRPGYPPSNYTGSSSIRKPTQNIFKSWPGMKFETTRVQCITLDSFCETHNIDHIDFIWMDVQGAEIDVFNGAKTMLDKIDYIYTEYCDRELYEGEIGLKAIINMLPQFEIVEDYKGDVLLKRK